MKILGITGGIGAGKSSVTRIFAELGAEIIDADQLAREILEPQGAAFSDVIAAFGKNILKPDGSIDRKKLAEIVFHNDEKLSLLNRLTHHYVFLEMERRIARSQARLICLDVPLLFSCEFPIACDKTLVVTAPEKMRIARVMKRDGCTRRQVMERMEKQLSEEVMRNRADMVIENVGPPEQLREAVGEIYKEMTEQE